MIDSIETKGNDNFNNRDSSSDKSPNEKHEISNKDLEFKADVPVFLFRVRKLGEKGFTHKTRLLFITPEKIS
jgi:hypothetical protein